MRAITMLIVFCPCVIVLATPTALVAAIGNAAMRGSLIKKGATVEALSHVDTVIFDKTGTLTAGKPRLLQTIALGAITEARLLERAAIAEKFSEHPMGKALVLAAGNRGMSLTDPECFEALPGLGVRARVGVEDVFLGGQTAWKSRGFPSPRRSGKGSALWKHRVAALSWSLWVAGRRKGFSSSRMS